MPFYQCDASGLVKRYVDEVGSDWVRAIVDSASTNIALFGKDLLGRQRLLTP